ncbi:Protein tyrosine kinase [Mactra antiquata]
MDQLITIGQVDASDTLGASLHYAALNGKKKILKKALDKGINVDYPNDEGQTPLFVASYGGHQSIVNYLLSAGADANEKTNLGLTAIHAACFSGHLKIVMRLLQAGGDLRLHDYQGRSAKDWAILNPNPKKRMKILEFLDKTRMFAMSSSGQDLLLNKASSKTLHRAHHRRNTVTNIIRNKIGRPSIHGNLEKMATSQHTLGFGQVYSHGHDTSGFMSAIPFVNENSLKHDQNGDTFENSGFCVMESVWWDYTKVTAKKLRSDIDPYHGGVVDLLINEIEHIGKLRHPNILTLMGVCQASNLDGLHLIFESIPEGSLFNYMHEQLKRLPTEMIQEIALQICDAIIFIHLRGLVHCSITSHAISIVNPHLFKLGNFEYMIEASKCEWGKKNAVACNTVENAVYNWMAPEVMMAMPASFYCDMYSFCAVLWEMFHGEIPWADECIESIKSNFGKGKGLKMSHGKIIEYFRIILEYGLQQEPTNRKMTFLHVRDILVAAPKDARNYVRTRLKHLHYSDDDSDPPGGRIGRNDDNIHTNHIAQQHQASTSYNIDNAMMRGQMKDRGRYGNKREINQYEYHHHQDGKTKPRWEKTKELKNSPQHYQPNYELHNKHNNEQKKDNFNFQSQPAIQTFGEEQVTSKNLPLRQLNDKRQSPIKQRNISGHHGDIQQPVQQLTYGSDGLKWENLPKEVGEEYIYTVQIKKEESPKKASAPVFEMSRNQNSTEDYEAASKYLEFTESETSQEDTSQTGLTTETTSSDSYQFAHGR